MNTKASQFAIRAANAAQQAAVLARATGRWDKANQSGRWALRALSAAEKGETGAARTAAEFAEQERDEARIYRA